LNKLTLEHDAAELERLARKTVGGILDADPPMPADLRLKAAIAVLPRRDKLEGTLGLEPKLPPGFYEALVTGDLSKLERRA
jgi:hypothetical protein